LKNVDLESFDKNTEKIAAVERMLEIIGEAANHISDEIKYDYKYSTPWKKIIGTRNIIIHEYFRVDNKVIYQTAKEDIIPLKSEIESILKELENSNK
jgi:uncharacterized protein with HEPN domain